jgi:methylmalonyl-CoA mutase
MEAYQSKNKIRIVTATSLFDGHDAAINVMRRIIQSSGAEVIHLGHNRSAEEVVDCAIQEDAQAIAMTSYQGGHLEYFKYQWDLLQQKGFGHIRLFGGGGGVILPAEMKELHAYGIARIYSPDDGRTMGLQGMINDLLAKSDFATVTKAPALSTLQASHPGALSQAITAAESGLFAKEQMQEIHSLAKKRHCPVLGITGTGGAGKSSLVDEFIRRFLREFPDKRVGVVAVDPSKRKTGGALLGDRIRMNSVYNSRVYMRSLATRQSHLSLSSHVQDTVRILQAAGFDLVLLETSGIGQSDTAIIDHCDYSLYVMTPEYGAATQLEKIDMIDFADAIALNKFDRRGAQDALRDVRKQFKRSRKIFEAPDADLPVVGTIASQFNDPGMNRLYALLMNGIAGKTKAPLSHTGPIEALESEKVFILPPDRTRYLSEISQAIRDYGSWVDEQVRAANTCYGLQTALHSVDKNDQKAIEHAYSKAQEKLAPECRQILESWPKKKQAFEADTFSFPVRDKEVKLPAFTESLSHTKLPKVAIPPFEAWGEILRWTLQENTPGEFPYTAGVFPLKREGEDPTRMFAGEGGPERTNKRFHYVSKDMPARRLSTAFDSVTLYGEDPALRPDIFGKIGNAGVSICCLDDAKKLYSGFDLCDPATSVSMTINGPAPMLLGFFLNAAIDQQCEKYIQEKGLQAEAEKAKARYFAERGVEAPRYLGELPEGNNGLGLFLLGITGDKVLPTDVYATIRAQTLNRVRGTVQADILKEDQAQNTCIFSTEFALRMMGDVQNFFIQNRVQNFYSVSISGYHIAEAGANPITQLAFTLANGFTFVEYYRSRGMAIDDFAPNLSFFFSNGVDPEYAVIGRVARRIWAKAMKLKYGANARSQKLKYHIQTSGRSLHAQEIDFNDIRTTLQAMYAIFDNCNSLHTNAYDEAITTPTEESVRRAMAIQLILNHELGLAKNQNPFQGSFVIEKLTDAVEAAVLAEFDRLTERGGVLGAMETMYQRGKIQEESLYYETLKHEGKYPIIGVNTFLSSKGSPTILPKEVIRSTDEEKRAQIQTVQTVKDRHPRERKSALELLQGAAVENKNVFTALMEAAKVCTLGEMTHALYAVGGEYRRNM